MRSLSEVHTPINIGSYSIGNNGYSLVDGYTGNGDHVNGTVDRYGTFSGYVDGEYMTCTEYSC